MMMDLLQRTYCSIPCPLPYRLSMILKEIMIRRLTLAMQVPLVPQHPYPVFGRSQCRAAGAGRLGLTGRGESEGELRVCCICIDWIEWLAWPLWGVESQWVSKPIMIMMDTFKFRYLRNSLIAVIAHIPAITLIVWNGLPVEWHVQGWDVWIDFMKNQVNSGLQVGLVHPKRHSFGFWTGETRLELPGYAIN